MRPKYDMVFRIDGSMAGGVYFLGGSECMIRTLRAERSPLSSNLSKGTSSSSSTDCYNSGEFAGLQRSFARKVHSLGRGQLQKALSEHIARASRLNQLESA